ncbi:MAG: methylenetetrahydrofolate--tRNA-(uracil(54)-C(5))-methyltransferase (FADH(2)-oxidizing) TrmFO, partial [Thermodesulfobacteriota bacterium]
MAEVVIIGGGLAGCEAAWQARRLGAGVTLYEMKPVRYSAAHSLSGLCELVCSNSLKSESVENGGGLLKKEMRLCSSLVMEAADFSRVPAGAAIAVDRAVFSSFVTERLVNAGVRIIREEVIDIPEKRPVVIATGPLTSDAFSEKLALILGAENLWFYDAMAPIVYKDSIDFSIAFMAARYNKGGADYINCPMNKVEYETFVNELLSAEKTPFREFEKPRFFEGCMPIETMAERGQKTLSFGPLRPVGIIDPRTGRRPYAVVQLRRENMEDTIYNIVGFQTRLLHKEQKRVFSGIPGLKDARFARYGGIHRNSYINSPKLLLTTLQLRKDTKVLFAGQITGVEGYCESASSGIIAGINAARLAKGLEAVFPPSSTMTGALLEHVSTPSMGDFQPMNANFGVLRG